MVVVILSSIARGWVGYFFFMMVYDLLMNPHVLMSMLISLFHFLFGILLHDRVCPFNWPTCLCSCIVHSFVSFVLVLLDILFHDRVCHHVHVRLLSTHLFFLRHLEFSSKLEYVLMTNPNVHVRLLSTHSLSMSYLVFSSIIEYVLMINPHVHARLLSTHSFSLRYLVFLRR